MYEKLREYINKSNNIVFFGGAGVSTESGIPDFRSKDGLYNQHDVRFDQYEPEYLLSRNCLYNNPKVFYEFYRQKLDTRNVEPNITHKVLAKMEAVGKLSAIVTQNIDGLHQKAGSENVFEIHGTTQRNYCSKCGKTYPADFLYESSTHEAKTSRFEPNLSLSTPTEYRSLVFIRDSTPVEYWSFIIIHDSTPVEYRSLETSSRDLES